MRSYGGFARLRHLHANESSSHCPVIPPAVLKRDIVRLYPLRKAPVIRLTLFPFNNIICSLPSPVRFAILSPCPEATIRHLIRAL